MTHSEALGGHYSTQPRISTAGVLTVVGLHAAVIGLLLSLDVVKLPSEMTTLMVHVIEQEIPKPLPEPPKIIPPKPRPPEKKPQPVPQPLPEPVPQPQVVAAQTAAPSSSGEAPPLVEPPPPAPAPAPEPAPVITPPGFDADYLDNPAPVYPAISRRLEEAGKTLLRVYVEPDGKPSQIQVKASSGSPRLDQAAQDAVWRWKFVPARRGEKTIGAWVQVPIVFNLKG
jgi:protein TonB